MRSAAIVLAFLSACAATVPALAEDRSGSLASVIARVSPSVVLLRIFRKQVPFGDLGPAANPFFSRELQQAEEREESASGFVVDAGAGLLVTSDYVVRDAGRIEAVLASGETRPATLVGLDEATGVGLVRIAPDGLSGLDWSAGEPEVGDTAILIAYVFKKGPIATTGIVSGRDHLDNYASIPALFLDVAVSRGAAGGVVTDRDGRVIAMAYGMYGTTSDPYTSLGVAIPATDMRPVIAALAADGRVRHGWIGISVVPVRLGDGAEIVAVTANSPAERAGLKVEDRIIALNDERLRDDLPLRRHVSRAPVGTTLTLTVQGSDGDVRDVSLVTEEQLD